MGEDQGQVCILDRAPRSISNWVTLSLYSYIEEFWYESYLSHSDPVVLALNPFFVLEYVVLHLFMTHPG